MSALMEEDSTGHRKCPRVFKRGERFSYAVASKQPKQSPYFLGPPWGRAHCWQSGVVRREMRTQACSQCPGTMTRLLCGSRWDELRSYRQGPGSVGNNVPQVRQRDSGRAAHHATGIVGTDDPWSSSPCMP